MILLAQEDTDDTLPIGAQAGKTYVVTLLLIWDQMIIGEILTNTANPILFELLFKIFKASPLSRLLQNTLN